MRKRGLIRLKEILEQFNWNVEFSNKIDSISSIDGCVYWFISKGDINRVLCFFITDFLGNRSDRLSDIVSINVTGKEELEFLISGKDIFSRNVEREIKEFVALIGKQ